MGLRSSGAGRSRNRMLQGSQEGGELRVGSDASTMTEEAIQKKDSGPSKSVGCIAEERLRGRKGHRLVGQAGLLEGGVQSQCGHEVWQQTGVPWRLGRVNVVRRLKRGGAHRHKEISRRNAKRGKRKPNILMKTERRQQDYTNPTERKGERKTRQ